MMRAGADRELRELTGAPGEDAVAATRRGPLELVGVIATVPYDPDGR